MSSAFAGVVRARKRFGQHFLEPAWVRKLLDVIRPTAADTFLEIGPGRGALTWALAEASRRVIAVEIDRDLAARLAHDAPANVEIIPGDFLEVDLAPLLPAQPPRSPGPIESSPAARLGALESSSASRHPPHLARVVGNLPYNVSSPILFRLLALHRDRAPFADATLLLQRQVADRLVSPPGSGDYGPLAILTQLYADARRSLVLPPGAFRPLPRVQSAVVQLGFRRPAVRLPDPGLFEAMVRSLFSQRRKTVLNALKPFAAFTQLSAAEAVRGASLDPRRRPETLQLTDLARLAESFVSANRGPML